MQLLRGFTTVLLHPLNRAAGMGGLLFPKRLATLKGFTLFTESYKSKK